MSVASGAAGAPVRGPGPRDRGGALARTGRILREYLPAVLVAVAGLVIWELVGPRDRTRATSCRRRTSIAVALATTGTTPATRCRGGPQHPHRGARRAPHRHGRWRRRRVRRQPLGRRPRRCCCPSPSPRTPSRSSRSSPLFNTWFGLLNPLSKMMMAAVLSFFPVMANVTRGLSGADPAALELMRSYAATEGTILRKVRDPQLAAVPVHRAQARASTLSLIGAIVAEYFGGQTAVLGQLVITSISACASTSPGRASPSPRRRDRVLPADRARRAHRDPMAQLRARRGLSRPSPRRARSRTAMYRGGRGVGIVRVDPRPWAAAEEEGRLTGRSRLHSRGDS